MRTDGSHPTQKWTVEITDTTTTVYTTTVIEEVVPGALRCVNPGNQSPQSWDPAFPTAGNPNCVQAYTQGGVQTEPPGFRIEQDEPEVIRTVVNVAGEPETASARTACWTRGGESKELTHQHCQVPGLD